MTRSKGDSQKGAKRRGGQGVTKHKVEINAPLKYKVEANDPKRRKVKVTLHKLADGRIVNAATTNAKEKTINVVIDTFDDGSEGEFLIFKRTFLQTIDDQKIEPATENSGAKRLYTLMKKA